ncbi:hypothetical protein niasHT_003895 [Heterodera trifolii]|uniref:Uncharacterized protein n=1 Tax=Heterodera trifolii TaxID=157864 RepID=A0ABD2LW83_9BILA
MCRLLPLFLTLFAVLVALCVSVEGQQPSAEQPRAVLLDLIPTELVENKRSPRHFAFAKRARSFAFAKRNANGWGRAFAFAKRTAELPQWNEKRFAFADGGASRRFAFAKRNYRNFAFA